MRVSPQLRLQVEICNTKLRGEEAAFMLSFGLLMRGSSSTGVEVGGLITSSGSSSTSSDKMSVSKVKALESYYITVYVWFVS